MKSIIAGLGLAILTAGSASAATLNFNNFSHGDTVSTVSVLGATGTVTADGNSAGSPDIAVAFNTNLTGTNDPDLEAPLMRDGNGRIRNFRDVLIIQENATGGPDDDGRGGVITISFDSTLRFLGFDVVDDATITVTSDLGDSLYASVAEDNQWNRFNADWDRISVLTFDFGTASGAIDNLRFDVATVPVPASLPLLAAAVGLLGWSRRRA